MRSPTDPDFTLVEDPAGLERLAAALRAHPEHALDSESNSGFVYRERLCLLQVNVGGELWLVDLIALPGGRKALDRLRGPLEDAERTTLLHGGEFDVACLKRDYGIALEGVWDSQQAASFLGRSRTGYGVLVEEICGVELEKAHAFFDWGRRPLPARALRYALDDVRYLPRVCRRLRREAAAAGLDEELAIANRVVMDSTWNGGFRPESIWRLKGVGRLPTAALPRLVALYRWRDEAGRRLDRPPGRVLGNRLLLSIAEAAPSSAAELRRLGLARGGPAELAEEVLRVLGAARRRPPPVPAPPAARRRGKAEFRRERRLREWRRAEASKRGVSEQAVLPSAALRRLAEEGAGALEAVPQLGAKRIRLYGAELRRLCAAR